MLVSKRCEYYIMIYKNRINPFPRNLSMMYSMFITDFINYINIMNLLANSTIN